MDTKPPTRTFPKLVMKEWPERHLTSEERVMMHRALINSSTLAYNISDKALSDFTRVVEEMGILDQERSQKEKSRDE